MITYMDNDKFTIIAITSPDYIDGEAERIAEILSNGEADIVHIRKPNWNEEAVAGLLSKIPTEFYKRLKIHDHFCLLERFPLMGVHLNARNGTPPKNVCSVSRSLHSVEQLQLSMHYDYVTLSPIFDSISKACYRSAFSLTELKPLLKGRRVIALGGVTPDRFPELREAGFSGAAMLGFFWENMRTLPKL